MKRIAALSPLFGLAAIACKDLDCPEGMSYDDELGQCITPDSDGDGWYDNQDCDPTNADINPGAAEVCDGADNDCNGLVDDDDGNLQAGPGESGATVWYADLDGDGSAGDSVTALACAQPDGYADTADDCDDFDASSYPGGTEICDGADNDCNGETDENDVCIGAFYGDITLSSQTGADEFCANYNGVVYGNVTVTGYGFTDLSAVSCLSEIYGGFTVDLPWAESLVHENLTHVDGDTLIYGGEAAEISFPGLVSSGGVVTVQNAYGITTLDLSGLESSLGVMVYDTMLMESIDLSSLVSISALYVYFNDVLTDVNLSSLDQVDELLVYYNNSLTTLDLSTMTTGGDLTFYWNDELTDVLMPNATTLGNINLQDNDSMTALDLSAASTLGGM